MILVIGSPFSVVDPAVEPLRLNLRCDGDHKSAFSCGNHQKKRLKRDGHHNRDSSGAGHHKLWPNLEVALRSEKPWKAGLPKPPPYCRACLSLWRYNCSRGRHRITSRLAKRCSWSEARATAATDWNRACSRS